MRVSLDVFSPKIGILIGIWLLSVVIRVPFLNRPLSIHHEWILAHLLITLEIWESKGLSQSKYALIYTYPQDKTNAHLDFIGGLKDKEGNYYYVSYPPLTFYAAYAFCKLFFLPIVPLTIQIFNLIWHFVCALVWYKLLELIFNSHKWAFWGYVWYLFLPFNLWYHGNVYFVDVLVQGLWIIYVYFWLKGYYQAQKARNYVVLFMVSFCLMYTEWIAAFIGVSTVIAGIFLTLKTRNYHWLLSIGVVGVAMLLALGLTLYQYTNIQDREALLYTLQHKYEFRSGRSQSYCSESILHAIKKLVYHYLKAYTPLLILIVISFFYSIWYKVDLGRLVTIPKVLILIFWGLPVALHHIILFGFTYFHEFSVLKSSFILIILSLWLMRKLNVKMAVAALLVLVQIGVYYALFYRYTDAYKNIGEIIKKERQSNELVVLAVTDDFWAIPQIMYYAKSNFYYEDKQLQDLPKFLDKHEIKKYVIFYIENDTVVSLKHIQR
ncbi:MAG: hypothetical protein NZ455_11720 [Bacteroidia bacterium]|nr:hypothetical protein [Bacteroidia bacterium]MDW8346745.1 hypothetical protein [Bacteroidia bacterium]